MYNIIGIFKVDIPLCDSVITIQIITVNTTKFWCLLKQLVLTHVGHFQAKQMYSITRLLTLLSVNMEISVYEFITSLIV